jgi:hypothetical protein
MVVSVFFETAQLHQRLNRQAAVLGQHHAGRAGEPIGQLSDGGNFVRPRHSFPPLRHALHLQHFPKGRLTVEMRKALCARGSKGQLEDGVFRHTPTYLRGLSVDFDRTLRVAP